MICQITGKYELFIKVLIWLTMWLDKCCYAFDVVSWYAQSKLKVQWTELIIWKSQWKSVKVIIFTFHVVLLKIITGTMCDSPAWMLTRNMIFLVFLNDINDALSQDHLNMKNTLYYSWFALKEKKRIRFRGKQAKWKLPF